MTKEELAKWLHDNYEAVAEEQNWNTQQSCKVEFDTLPDANKRTMIEIADRLLNFNLLRLHFCVGRSEYKQHYIEWRDRYFSKVDKVFEYKTKNKTEYFTTEELHKKYEKAMLESPFNDH